MSYLVYLFFRSFRWILATLPIKVTYALCHLLALVFIHLMPYRKKVIFKNLKIAFPKQKASFFKTQLKAYYHHLAQIILESIRGLDGDGSQIVERFKIKNPELLEQFYRNKQSVIVAAGHLGNWEWAATALSHQLSAPIVVLYKPINNRHIDQYFNQLRGRDGLKIVPINETSEIFKEFHNKAHIFVMIADQSPSKSSNAVWVDFFQKKTAFLRGVSTYSRKHNLPVVYGPIYKKKKGFYEVELTEFECSGKSSDEQDILQEFASRLEHSIRNDVGSWLWSHNRWKLSNKV